MVAPRSRRAPGLRRIALVALLFGCASSPSVPPVQTPPSADAWVASTLARLPLRRKVAQLVFPRIPGAFLPAESDSWKRIRGWVETEGVGGIIATLGPPMEAAANFNALQEMSELPLLVTADMENGPGQLLNGGTVLPYGLDNGGGTRFPPAMALGATGDPELAWKLGRITALEARAVGVHMTFAPVVDVNNNPGNPIINTRSFGADATLVGRFAVAQIRGLQQNGLIATAKHFPGHGDTGTDSHIELPVIEVDRARADSVELAPYRDAIEAGVDAVMSAHIAFPALTGDTIPATLNPRLLTGLLREELGFDGIIVTDALDMGAIVKRFGATDAAVKALEAGADMLLQPNPEDVGALIDAVVQAVRRGDLSEARIDRSVRRILAAKARLGLHERRTVDLAAIRDAVATEEHRAVAQEAADRSITVVRDDGRMLPIRGGRVLAVVFAGDPDPWAGRTFEREFAAAVPTLETLRIDANPSTLEVDEIRRRMREADAVVLAPFIRVGAAKGALAVPEPVAGLFREIIRTRPALLASFGNPYLLEQFPEVGTYLLAWGQWEMPQRAAARALTGAIPITGRLPIPLPPWYRIGDGLEIDPDASDRRPASPLGSPLVGPLPTALPDEVGFDARLPVEVDKIVRQAILQGAAPGAAVVVGRAGRIALSTTHGRLDTGKDSWLVTDSSIYDLASLTKVVATTTAVMLLVDDGLIGLDVPVSQYLPEWGTSAAHRRVTVRNLLTHTSGLPAWSPLYTALRGRQPYALAIGDTPLEAPPGKETVYSDLGAILLGLVVERVSGEPLDVLLQHRVFGPLGMRDTGFNPLLWSDDPAVLARIAPTEVDTVFRHRHLRGEVHDENAWAIGGVAGHAGLFSSARDLSRFAQMLLNGGRYGGLRVLREETVLEFTRRQSDTSSRALGWDTPSEGSSAGDHFSDRSFGHTGFTGTSLWIDPERDLFVILLTNRVNPTRDNPRIGPLRRAVHDAVQRAARDVAGSDR